MINSYQPTYILKLTLLLLIFADGAFASTKELPRFAALKVSEANIRTGPGSTYPVKWVFVKKNMPVEIIAEFENWYKIRDNLQYQGWVHKTLIYSKRYFISQKEAILYKSPLKKYNIPLYKFEKNIIGQIKSCRAEWCEVRYKDYYGWTHKSNIWGVYASENF